MEKKHFTQPLSKQEPLWKSPVRPETLQILEASRSVWWESLTMSIVRWVSSHLPFAGELEAKEEAFPYQTGSLSSLRSQKQTLFFFFFVLLDFCVLMGFITRWEYVWILLLNISSVAELSCISVRPSGFFSGLSSKLSFAMLNSKVYGPLRKLKKVEGCLTWQSSDQSYSHAFVTFEKDLPEEVHLGC